MNKKDTNSSVQFFAEDFTNPTYWITTALQLFAVVELLDAKVNKEHEYYINNLAHNIPNEDSLSSSNYQRVQLMLAGFGFEAFLKYQI